MKLHSKLLTHSRTDNCVVAAEAIKSNGIESNRIESQSNNKCHPFQMRSNIQMCHNIVIVIGRMRVCMCMHTIDINPIFISISIPIPIHTPFPFPFPIAFLFLLAVAPISTGQCHKLKFIFRPFLFKGLLQRAAAETESCRGGSKGEKRDRALSGTEERDMDKQTFSELDRIGARRSLVCAFRCFWLLLLLLLSLLLELLVLFLLLLSHLCSLNGSDNRPTNVP